MTRTMYDSTNAGDIPRSATMVGGYVDGLYANVAQLRQRFPRAQVVTITVRGAAHANVADCETDDLTPVSAAAWAKREVSAGRKPTIYCEASQWRAVELEVAKLGLTGKVAYWIANYDGHPVVPAGAVAKQYADPGTHGRGHFDLSVVADYWPGVDVVAPHKKPPSRAAVVRLLRRAIRRLNHR